MGGTYDTHRGIRNACRIFIIIHGRTRPLGRPRRVLENNIYIVVKGTGCEDVDWIGVAQVRIQCGAVVNMVMPFRVPLKAGIFLIS
jgi:hypothetical protein